MKTYKDFVEWCEKYAINQYAAWRILHFWVSDGMSFDEFKMCGEIIHSMKFEGGCLKSYVEPERLVNVKS